MPSETLSLRAIQMFVELYQVRYEQHVLAAVRFGHEISEGGALSHGSRDIAEDHQAPSVGHTFLNELASKPRFELEELLCEPFDRNKDHLDLLLDRLADQIQSILFAHPLYFKPSTSPRISTARKTLCPE